MPICKAEFPKKISVSLIFTALVCLVPLLFLAAGSKPEQRRTVAGGYIALVTGERTDDRLVAEKLKTAGLKDVLSESSQWFFLNGFSELRRVPLDEFADSLIETDPRNDGYASRLREIFVRDGRRYFYIPQSSIRSSDPAVIERRVKDALEDTPYIDIAYGAYPRDDPWTLFIFVAAAMICLAISACASKPLSGGSVKGDPALLPLTAAVLPAAALFTGSGAAGFALAAVMMALFVASRPLLKSLFIRLRLSGGYVISASNLSCVKQLFLSEKETWLLLLVMLFTVCLAARSGATRVPLAVLFFCLSASVAVGEESAPRGGHIRFFPVAIRPDAGGKCRHALIALPFTLASIAALVIPLFAQPRAGAAIRPDTGKNSGIPLVSADDYAAHVEFQQNFSLKRLASADDVAYTVFGAGADGLLHPSGSAHPIADTNAVIPPFPLERLAGFLAGTGADIPLPPVFEIRSLIAALMGMAIYLPVIAAMANANRKKERNKLYITQRESA
ncbi:MAG: hypothetical protein LBH50_05470 [Spirochaetaceae bacterium]|jgi:hypothetical protein|nr:hypothetical protein [Spirochaetaceae bacterium]